MHCRNCSGNEFRETGSGNYKCSYCGTLYYEEKNNIKKTLTVSGKRIKFIIISAAVLCIIIPAVFYFTPKPSNTAPETVKSDSGSTFQNENRLPEPAGEVISVDAIPDSIGNVYFLVMCRNSGKVAIRQPMITIRLLSENNEKLASGNGYAFTDHLNPGEITPVYLIVSDCPGYKKYETEFIPELPFLVPEGGLYSKKFTGEFFDVTMKQTYSSRDQKINGKIKNVSGYDAKFVRVAAILYSKNDKAIGYGYTFVSEKVLKPDAFDFFEIYVSTVTEVPEYYKLYYYGNVE